MLVRFAYPGRAISGKLGRGADAAVARGKATVRRAGKSLGDAKDLVNDVTDAGGTWPRLVSPSPYKAAQQGKHKKNQENEKQHLCDACCCNRDPTEAENCSNKRDDEKGYRPP
jgi:hypothetical protein